MALMQYYYILQHPLVYH